uniref:Uncharacterized protein n=1 Tax=Schistocephalus solidus TaxID=70667 RepID=A0A0X3NQK7_SCHSO
MTCLNPPSTPTAMHQYSIRTTMNADDEKGGSGWQGLCPGIRQQVSKTENGRKNQTIQKHNRHQKPPQCGVESQATPRASVFSLHSRSFVLTDGLSSRKVSESERKQQTSRSAGTPFWSRANCSETVMVRKNTTEKNKGEVDATTVRLAL